MTSFILIDVEVESAGNGTPFSSRMSEFGCVDLKTGKAFEGILFNAAPDENNPALSVIVDDPAFTDHTRRNVFKSFQNWLDSFEDRVVFVSDNNGFDLAFFNFTWDKYMNCKSPAGHSSRRISDIWAGMQAASGKKTWRDTQSWKKFRVTPHSHRAVEDSMGNREALLHMLEMYDQELL